jgi:hypothetical protein
MPESKSTRKGAQPSKKAFKAESFAANAASFLENLQIVPNGTEETAPGQAGQQEGKPVVVNKLIDFIKKM